jgi:hypothetical protein
MPAPTPSDEHGALVWLARRLRWETALRDHRWRHFLHLSGIET